MCVGKVWIFKMNKLRVQFLVVFQSFRILYDTYRLIILYVTQSSLPFLYSPDIVYAHLIFLPKSRTISNLKC